MQKLVKEITKQIYYFIFPVSYEQSDKKNLLLFTSCRGGSTWLTQLIAASSNNIRTIDHAIGWHRVDYYDRKFLPKTPLGQFITADQWIEN